MIGVLKSEINKKEDLSHQITECFEKHLVIKVSREFLMDYYIPSHLSLGIDSV